MYVASYIDWLEGTVWPNETATQSTLMLHTTNKITSKASTKPKVESKTEEPTTPKVEIEIVSSPTSQPPPKNGTKTLELKNIIIIVAVLLLVLCVAVACFQVNKSRNSQNVAVNVQYTARD